MLPLAIACLRQLGALLNLPLVFRGAIFKGFLTSELLRKHVLIEVGAGIQRAFEGCLLLLRSDTLGFVELLLVVAVNLVVAPPLLPNQLLLGLLRLVALAHHTLYFVYLIFARAESLSRLERKGTAHFLKLPSFLVLLARLLLCPQSLPQRIGLLALALQLARLRNPHSLRFLLVHLIRENRFLKLGNLLVLLLLEFLAPLEQLLVLPIELALERLLSENSLFFLLLPVFEVLQQLQLLNVFPVVDIGVELF